MFINLLSSNCNDMYLSVSDGSLTCLCLVYMCVCTGPLKFPDPEFYSLSLGQRQDPIASRMIKQDMRHLKIRRTYQWVQSSPSYMSLTCSRWWRTPQPGPPSYLSCPQEWLVSVVSLIVFFLILKQCLDT